jgi:alpha-L-rhamnosidase
MKIKRSFLLLLLAAPNFVRAVPNPPDGLMCGLLAEPELTVITSDRPRLCWIVNDPGRGAVQSAFEVLVSSSREALSRDQGEIWDSGRIRSAQSVDVPWTGPSLRPGRVYFWKVRTWDGAGAASPYSEPQEFRLAPAGAAPAFADRYPLEKTEIPPRRMVRKGPGDYFIDFGRAAFGTVKLTLAGRGSEPALEVRLGEVLLGTDAINPDPGGARRYRVMTVPLRAEAGTYVVAITPWPGNSTGSAIRMPAEVGEVMPFRYCELLGVPGEIGPAQVRQIAVHYHFNDTAADFQSSDPGLNQVWALCHYTIEATSFTGTYIDGDRERTPYEADTYINQLGHYSTDREFSLARHTAFYLLDHATWPAEWQMHMPLVAWADYLHTGNADLLTRRYDELSAKTLVALERADGLVEAGSGPAAPGLLKVLHMDGHPPPERKRFIRQEILDPLHPKARLLQTLTDWPPGESDGYEMRPVGAVTNAFHYRSLRVLAGIAAALGKAGDERKWTRRAERVYRSFNAIFLDPGKGIYLDGEGSRHSSLHANMFPLAFGLVPPERISGVAAFIKTRGMGCSVYGAQYLFEALYRAGEADYALALLTAGGDRSWPHMIHDVGTTLTLEAWDDKFKPNQDWNHAWGAAPANIIPRLLMGIEPLAPGFARFRVRPQTASLARAALSLPTIRGQVKLEVSCPDPRTWRAALRVPANTTAEFEIPASNPEAVSEGGRPAVASPPVKFLRVEGGRAVFEVPGGEYFFRGSPLTDALKFLYHPTQSAIDQEEVCVSHKARGISSRSRY